MKILDLKFRKSRDACFEMCNICGREQKKTRILKEFKI